MSTSPKDIISGITKGITTGVEAAKTEIAAKKTDEPSAVSQAASKAASALKSAGSSVTTTVKDVIVAATERTELFDSDLAGFDMTNMTFYKDTGNIGTTLLEPASVFNAELMVMSELSEKKAIGIPNLFLHTHLYGYFNMEILDIWKNYFDIELDEQNIESDFCGNLSYSICDIIPAELKFKSSYCELNKKGKLTLIPVILEEDEEFSSDDVETTTEDEAETQAEADSEAESEAMAATENEADAKEGPEANSN